MKATALRLLAIGIGIVLLASAYAKIHSPSVMTESARAFLTSLTPEERARATFQFTNDERFNWHYIPKVRKGLPFKDMNSAQKHLAHALLSAGLSQRGYIKAITIMSLDEVLKALEKGSGPVRDPEGYFFSVFGEPSENGTWGYRIEGHHLSQNFTIANGKVQGAPSFFGANPAEVREGPRKGLRVLGREEDLGRALVQSLTPEQKKVAIVDENAPADILTVASRKAALNGQPSGLQASKLTSPQRELLQNLLNEYCNNMPEQVADTRQEQIKKAGANLYFAWAGGEQPGDPHYYRIQAPAFLVEYDDTQNGANHIHSVWRDYEGDFGLDLLKEHYQTSHIIADPLPAAVPRPPTTKITRPSEGGESSIRGEVARIERGQHSTLPPAVASPLDATVSFGSTQRTVENGTAYSLTVLFAGPVERRITLAPGRTEQLALSPGTYKVAAHVSAPNVLPFFGVQSYSPGQAYTSHFYIH